MREARAQAAALTSQIESIEDSGRLAAEELKLNEKLVAEGYVPRARLLPLQRADADSRSRLGESRGELALARQRAAELQARMADARNRYQQAATEELEAVVGATARARRTPASLERPGGSPGHPLAGRRRGHGPARHGHRRSARRGRAHRSTWCPSNEMLVVEARIRPQDINHVFADAKAKVRLAAFDARTTPHAAGPRDLRIARSHERRGNRRIVVRGHRRSGRAALKHHPEIQLKAGMPAELFVTTSDRTLFEYLVSPITAFTNRAHARNLNRPTLRRDFHGRHQHIQSRAS